MPKEFKLSAYKRAYFRNYYAAHSEMYKANSLKYYYAHHEERKAYNREYQKKKRDANKQPV